MKPTAGRRAASKKEKIMKFEVKTKLDSACRGYIRAVRPMRPQSIIAVLMLTSVQLWAAHARAADNDSVGKMYTVQATDVARRVILAETREAS